MAALASRMAQLQSRAALAQLQSRAAEAAKHGGALRSEAASLAAKHGGALRSEAASLAAKHGGALQSKVAEAATFAAKHGATLQSKASEAASFAAKHGSAMQSRASEAASNAAKRGCEYHRTLMERNRQYVVDPPTVEKCRELSKQLFYTRLASIPGRYESFWKEVDGVKFFLKNRKDLKVEQVGVAALFGIELYAWLCAGEIIGSGFTLTGYHV
ncbi:uncharacterized protein LOC123444300 [Hordeum vulgare subsp. vulgare]|uniref:Predicted protein n=1 Tax=Hordeum vulgare subsp. vulgare TaxID=112509 RepID=F2ED16_HORVV|nr:uncharacterized protein LOC123444300 [Hordeum vulgare subsp. vulgare]BAK05238.1 predicted protein [Hordeum vulgare subsp. vulgare]